MAKKKDPTISMNLVKAVKGKGIPLNKAITLVANKAGISEQTVAEHYGKRKLPPGEQSKKNLDHYISDGRFIDELAKNHPDDKDRIESELRPLYV